MANKFDTVGVVDADALDMVEGVVVQHPDKPDKWIVAKPVDEDA